MTRAVAFLFLLTSALTGAGALTGDRRLVTSRAELGPDRPGANRTLPYLAWVPIDSPVTEPHRNLHGCCWDPVRDRIYMYGGSPDFTDTATRLCQRYDPGRDTWTDLAPMATPRRMIKGLYCRGRIYAIAGDSQRIALRSCEAYDIASNVWHPIAPLPKPLCGYQAVVWRDSLIYVMGGRDTLRSTRKVWIYSPLADTWTAGDSLPVACAQGDACVIGDNVYFAGDLLPEIYDTAMTVGAINPLAPNRITWTRGPLLPFSRYDGPTVALQGKVCWFGGNTSLPEGYTRAVYVYDPANGETSQLPDYPTFVVNCCLGVVRESRAAIYGLAGDQGHAPIHPAGYYRLSAYGDHDVGAQRIVAPAAVIDSGDSVTPIALIRNFGAYPEGFRVRFRIGMNYTADDSIFLAAGESIRISFTPWTANLRGTVTAACSTRLIGDDQPDNDAAQDTCVVVAFNAGVSGLYLPDTITEGPFAPVATVSNYSRVPGEVWIDWRTLRDDTLVYSQNESTYLEIGASQQVWFSSWNAVVGSYQAKVYTMHGGSVMHDTIKKNFCVVAAGIADRNQNEVLPGEVALDAPEPNPCRDGAVIRYALPHAANVSLKLYDRTGKCAAVLSQGLTRAGWHSCAFIVHRSEFIGTPGVYFVRLQAAGIEKTRKVIVAE